MGKHESLDEDVTVEEDMRRMAVALRRTALHSRDPHSIGDIFLPPASRETPDMERNRAMRDNWSYIPRHTSIVLPLRNYFGRPGRSGAY